MILLNQPSGIARGQFSIANIIHSGDLLLTDVINTTGRGKLVYVCVVVLTTIGNIKITVDDKPSQLLSLTNDIYYFIEPDNNTTNSFRIVENLNYARLDLEYILNMRVQVQQTNAANQIRCTVFSQADS